MKKLLLSLIIIILLGCEVDYITSKTGTSYKETFEYLSQKVQDNYVYLDFKGIDYNSIYNKYSQRLSSIKDNRDFFYFLEEYMHEFRDGHSDIRAPGFKSTSYYNEITKYGKKDTNPNFSPEATYRIYFNYPGIPDNERLNGSIRITEGSPLLYGIITKNNKKYGYIFYGSFMTSISEAQLLNVISYFSTFNVKGIILDIRNNGGGSLANVLTLARIFGNKPQGTETEILKVWQRISKTEYQRVNGVVVGPYTELSFKITPHPNVYTGPVALLTNRGCYSASSFTATAFKNYDNVKQIGTMTGGGMGLPIGGMLPNGWYYRLSGNIGLDSKATSIDQRLDKNFNYEDGVPADIEVEMDPEIAEKNRTVDEIIERAITWINIGA